MKSKFLLVLFAGLFAVLSTAFASPAVAQDARITAESHRSFEQTVDQLKSAVGQGGMMVMASVDQGNMLSMTGLKLKATLFLVGNPTVGKQLFEQDHGVGLYVPLRVFVTEEKDGQVYLSYEKPSAQLQQFDNPEIDKIAAMLDQKLQNLAQMATR